MSSKKIMEMYMDVPDTSKKELTYLVYDEVKHLGNKPKEGTVRQWFNTGVIPDEYKYRVWQILSNWHIQRWERMQNRINDGEKEYSLIQKGL